MQIHNSTPRWRSEDLKTEARQASPNVTIQMEILKLKELLCLKLSTSHAQCAAKWMENLIQWHYNFQLQNSIKNNRIYLHSTEQSRCGTCHIINQIQCNYINSVTTIMQEYYITITYGRII
jgi:hypothetical protein